MRHSLGSYLIPIALVMLVAWAVATFYFSAPGWFHGFLTLGIFLLLWGIIDRPTKGARSRPK
jgi:ABC-type multidrug transport system permease subunit